jgi:general secretion pathway protein C
MSNDESNHPPGDDGAPPSPPELTGPVVHEASMPTLELSHPPVAPDSEPSMGGSNAVPELTLSTEPSNDQNSEVPSEPSHYEPQVHSNETTGLKDRVLSTVKNAVDPARWKEIGTRSMMIHRRIIEQVKQGNLEPMALLEWANQAFKSGKAGSGSGFWGKLATIALCAFFLANITSLIAGRFIPEPPLIHGGYNANQGKKVRTPEDYNVIFTRNLFNVPVDNASDQNVNPDNPVKSALPLNLIGTMILTDETRSIATIEDKSLNTVYPVRKDDEIPTKIRILKVEPTRVVFQNLQNNHAEFIELPEDAAINTKIEIKSSKAGISQASETQFNLDRHVVDNAMKDLNNILTQARAVPNFENGLPAGYRLFQIVPGSIYAQLGLKDGDVINGVNGSPINDPGKAFEMLSDLKTANHLELQVKRDGRVATYSYDIH